VSESERRKRALRKSIGKAGVKRDKKEGSLSRIFVGKNQNVDLR